VIPKSWEDDDDAASDVGSALSETDELNQPVAEDLPSDARRVQLMRYILNVFVPGTRHRFRQR